MPYRKSDLEVLMAENERLRSLLDDQLEGCPVTACRMAVERIIRMEYADRLKELQERAEAKPIKAPDWYVFTLQSIIWISVVIEILRAIGDM